MVVLKAEPIKNTSGEEKMVKVGGRVAPQSKQPGLNDPAGLISQRHASSTSTSPSAPQSRDATLRLVPSRQIMLPSDEKSSLTGRSNPPGIPVVPAFEVENCFFFHFLHGNSITFFFIFRFQV